MQGTRIHNKSTSAPGSRKRNQFGRMSVPCRFNQTKKHTNAVLCTPGSKLHPINAVQKQMGKTLRHEAETRSPWQGEARRGSPQIQVHAARVLAIRCSNKHLVTPWSREAVFRNLGVVQDLLRKWCHQFRTAAWPRRIMTTNLSQHHSNKTCLS